MSGFCKIGMNFILLKKVRIASNVDYQNTNKSSNKCLRGWHIDATLFYKTQFFKCCISSYLVPLSQDSNAADATAGVKAEVMGETEGWVFPLSGTSLTLHLLVDFIKHS
jgi:hypothetical protein